MEKENKNEAKILICNFHKNEPNVKIYMKHTGMNARNKIRTLYHEKKS